MADDDMVLSGAQDSGSERIGEIEFHVGNPCILSAEGITSSRDDFYRELHIDGDDLVCVVTAVGSNYVEVSWPNMYLDSGNRASVNRSHIRLHTDKLHYLTPISREKIDAYLAGATSAAMEQVTLLTARADRMVNGQLPMGGQEGASGAGALIAMNQCPSPAAARQSLEIIRDEALPAIYREIGIAIGQTRMTMEFQLLLMTASVRPMKDMIENIEAKLFTIELYAGVNEEVRHFKSGAPASADEKLHVFQQMIYMDEESLMDYQAGGMDFKSVDEWDEWLSRPDNMSRIMPFPKTMMIARVRRHKKERERHTIAEMFARISEEKADKKTFIYTRNGENLYRIDTMIDFGGRAFPDPASIAMNEEMVFEMFAGSVRSIKPLRVHEADIAAGSVFHNWRPLNPSSVYFDDAMAFLKAEADAFRRFGLILQGLFDRSDILQPCPPVRLWDNQSFASAVDLILDGDRTLYHGEKPDFEAYRNGLNAQATDDSVFIGQMDYWMRQEAQKENQRQRKDFRIKTPTVYARFIPWGDPGPALLSKGRLIRGKKVLFSWSRMNERTLCNKQVSLSAPMSELLNVSAYRKGDYKRFFSDPRTRAEYLQWAPLLLGAEDYLAAQEEGQTPSSVGIRRPHSQLLYD